MDEFLGVCDCYIFTPYIYPVDWPEDYAPRQCISLWLIIWFSVFLLYFFTATFSYFFVFDHQLKKHPLYIKKQISLEIKYTSWTSPLASALMAPLFLAECRGYTKLYNSIDERGWPFVIFSIISFMMFTDCLIYWIHRGLHHRSVYKAIHKAHHSWKIVTPFSSHAMNPVDAWLQSVPYHIYPFIFPLNKYLHIALLMLVNFWAISVHDGNFKVPDILKPIINGSAHHTDHHMFFNYNYGQYFTFWDRVGGSFRVPSAFEGKSPLDELKKK
ncbi:lathosterol oxidase-like isoform X1 [Anneissia japonica]|uniref:lathosterol oxidase-like isoform X1 n=1 Tax=Anneissia japonica TaxID=1529436 RepID=UPI0014255EC8|nr:lathosterol oxidase-like isoform X1 [Anneissia japonica]